MTASPEGGTARRAPNDIELARMMGLDPDAPDFAEVRARLAAVAAAPAGPRAEDARRALVTPEADGALAAALDARLAAEAERVAAAVADGKARSPERVAAVRREMAAQGLAGFLVPLADEHQSEFVPPSAQRLAWLTGFTGSAGLAIVLADEAAIFVDGRYTLAVQAQVRTDLFVPNHIGEAPPGPWLAARVAEGDRIGYDPWLHTRGGLAALKSAVERVGASLVPVERNPVDVAWTDRPSAPLSPVIVQPLARAGESAADKCARLGAAMAGEGVDAAVLTAPDSIAWLLNVRGADVPHNPLPLSFAILDKDGHVELFIDPRKIGPDVRGHLGNLVTLRPADALVATLDTLGAAKARVRVDNATAASAIADRLEAAGATVSPGADPCALPKATKNAVELAGIRDAHARDGVALVRFLAWLAREAPKGGLDELTASDRLEAFRAEHPWYRGGSFDTISGAGPNGAIVHYRATPETNRQLEPGTLYLVDSGAQYADGTTDVTRTLTIGTPSPEHRDRFTRVLKGHIALARARFPRGTTGSQLDALARLSLWEAGLDYDHGTGHGVGHFLCVHEGPHRISKIANSVALEPGMIVSNEPGYYKTGAYGIRIENLVAVVEGMPIPGGERPMLAFESLTLAPIDRTLIESALLSTEERAWLDAYHARVLRTLRPYLGGEDLAWLEAATAAI
jgi:Xaa-Pro aminopeptidase